MGKRIFLFVFSAFLALLALTASSFLVSEKISAHAASTITGKVYQDQNINATFEEGEPEMPAWGVGFYEPDGTGFPLFGVESDGDGNYSIDVEPATYDICIFPPVDNDTFWWNSEPGVIDDKAFCYTDIVVADNSTYTFNFGNYYGISSTKTLTSNATAFVGETVEFTLTITNDTPVVLDNVYMTDIFETTSLQFLSSDITPNFYQEEDDFTQTYGLIDWFVGILNPGQSFVVNANFMATGTDGLNFTIANNFNTPVICIDIDCLVGGAVGQTSADSVVISQTSPSMTPEPTATPTPEPTATPTPEPTATPDIVSVEITADWPSDQVIPLDQTIKVTIKIDPPATGAEVVSAPLYYFEMVESSKPFTQLISEVTGNLTANISYGVFTEPITITETLSYETIYCGIPPFTGVILKDPNTGKSLDSAEVNWPANACESPTPTPSPEPTATPTPTPEPTSTPTPVVIKEVKYHDCSKGSSCEGTTVLEVNASGLSQGQKIKIKGGNTEIDGVVTGGDGSTKILADFNGLTKCTNYEVVVYDESGIKATSSFVYDPDGNCNKSNSNSSSSSNSSESCSAVSPVAPTLNGFANINSATLNWNEVSNSSHYMVRFGTQSGIYTFGASNIGDVNTYVVNALGAGTTYYFQVAAVNGCAGGVWSNELVLRTGGFATNFARSDSEGRTSTLGGGNQPLESVASSSGETLGVTSQNSCVDVPKPWWIPLLIQFVLSIGYVAYKRNNKDSMRTDVLPILIFGVLSQVAHIIIGCNCTSTLCDKYLLFNFGIVASSTFLYSASAKETKPSKKK